MLYSVFRAVKIRVPSLGRYSRPNFKHQSFISTATVLRQTGAEASFPTARTLSVHHAWDTEWYLTTFLCNCHPETQHATNLIFLRNAIQYECFSMIHKSS